MRALVAFLILLKSPWHGSVQGGHFAIFRPTKQNLLNLLNMYYWNIIIITIKELWRWSQLSQGHKGPLYAHTHYILTIHTLAISLGQKWWQTIWWVEFSCMQPNEMAQHATKRVHLFSFGQQKAHGIGIRFFFVDFGTIPTMFPDKFPMVHPIAPHFIPYLCPNQNLHNT